VTDREPQVPSDQRDHERLPVFALLLALFCSLLLISNIGATKLLQVGPLVADGGALLFPLTYIVGDVLAEVYGMSRTRLAVLMGFIISALASITFLFVDLLPSAPDWPHGQAWHDVLGFVPRIVVASLVGYCIGQLLNAYVLTTLKHRAQPGSLWWRLLSSSLMGEFVDTVLFCTIAFAGVVGFGTLTNYILVGYAYKIGVEALLLPVTIAVIRQIQRYLGCAPTRPGDSTVGVRT